MSLKTVAAWAGLTVLAMAVLTYELAMWSECLAMGHSFFFCLRIL